MKHYRFCAADFIGWIRVIRPGSILGPQQQFLLQMQRVMFKDSDKSPLFANLSNEFKEYALNNEKTDQAIEAKMTEEEWNIAKFGDNNQGGNLFDAKAGKF